MHTVGSSEGTGITSCACCCGTTIGVPAGATGWLLEAAFWLPGAAVVWFPWGGTAEGTRRALAPLAVSDQVKVLLSSLSFGAVD